MNGMCATLFNMGIIHDQNKDNQNSMIHWLSAYGIAKKIGDAQALSELSDLAQQLGGKDLSFWKRKII